MFCDSVGIVRVPVFPSANTGTARIASITPTSGITNNLLINFLLSLLLSKGLIPFYRVLGENTRKMSKNWQEFLRRRQKKVLSLVLCVAMMLSVMVVGAGAAFSDQSKIKNTEAVDACTALNIIGGYPDGSFKPEGNITRAEVTKMICVALNGGKEPNLATNATPTFSDVRTNANSAWAEKYIESCASQGIVSGVGGGKFAPAGNVTGTQLAKMLLVALGYKSENEGFTGNAWATNVNTVASAKGLYEGLESIDPSAAITRDNAAQMVWNALNAYEVEYKTNLVADKDGKLSTQITVQDKVVGDNDDKITLLEDKYEAKAITGTLSDVTQDNGKDTYSITVDNPMYKGKAYADYTGKDGDTPYVTYTDVTNDYSALKYQNVRVLVKPSKNGKDAVVYGVYATSKNTTQTGLLADLKMDGAKAKLDGTKYSLAKKQSVYVNGNLQYVKTVNTKGEVTATTSKKTEATTVTGTTTARTATIDEWIDLNAEGNATNDKGSTVKLLATDGTTNYSILEVTTYSIDKVTYVGKDYLTLKTGGKMSNDDFTYSSEIKKDDYVVVSAAGNYANNKGLIEKATVVEGKIDSTKTTKINSVSKINKVQINGTWYSTNVSMTGNTALNMSSSVKLVLVNGYIYYIDKVTTAATDIALLVEAGSTNSAVNSKYQARLIFTDGSDKVVDIEKRWDDDSNKEPISLKEKDGPILVSYDVSKNVYTLTKLDSTEKAGYDEYVTVTGATVDGSATGTISSTTNNVTKLYFESTGIVFVKEKAESDNTDADYKVVTGKTASNWDLNSSLNGKLKVAAVADYTNKNLYAQVAVVDFGVNKTSGSSDKTYAVALDSSYTSKQDGTTYTLVKAWNGKEEATYKYEGTKSIAAGDIFEYSADGTDTVDIDVVATYTADTAKVKSYDDGTGDIDLDGGRLASGCKSKIDSKDTVVLYVDSDAGAGVGSGEIRQANKYNDSSDKDVVNVVFYSEAGEDQITVLVVDVNNDYTQW